MTRKLSAGKLVIASHNEGKVREIRDLLAPLGMDVISAAELDLPEPVEDGDSFIANSLIKSLAAAKASGFPAMADDSGLAVKILDGAPGIYSARWAGPRKDFGAAMKKIQDAITDYDTIEQKADRSASFICALSLAWPDGHTEVFEGRVDGQMVWPMRGEHGFGYDPTFQPNGYDITFGEMDPSEKHEISHRADAFKQMVNACF
ncbi:RdgB/HAM1 family non-canonical purine NTP pyrophosphatase [Terasakiella sp. A23]|uniref:RdgB/HAM1 family non-canonical purine NTP pyrophosphatase n=1 Tax=Terasakiella sp. FCG-A23 TaxID=3080561 RepID=UPI002955AD2A|nr:RdgB/HAM1 family non-canonical purine NTP pyrophosphatase [Terasakiella sp. A23]MDV7339694.1 RdgB/HAM1 family non-canonical purine NTP pyrophosphatase [Terasakiella sp. A23]